MKRLQYAEAILSDGSNGCAQNLSYIYGAIFDNALSGILNLRTGPRRWTRTGRASESAERSRHDRSDRLLGRRCDHGLALADDHPAQGRLSRNSANAAARKLGDAWDPAKDEAAGEQCRSYGAPNIMKVPGRLHITWTDDRTLKLETDAGQQTRIFHFGAPQGQGGDWQGVSVADWDTVSFGNGLVSRDVPSGAMKVVTTKFKPGYLQKNGVPYSANGVLTEYFDVVKDSNGDYLVDSITFEDPTYLTSKYETAVTFKKQPDAAGWNPQPCHRVR